MIFELFFEKKCHIQRCGLKYVYSLCKETFIHKAKGVIEEGIYTFLTG